MSPHPVAPANPVPVLGGINQMDLIQQRMRAVKARAVKFRIDDYATVGYLRIVVDMKPITIGGPSERVYDEWIDADTFTVPLHSGQNLPLQVRGFRYPIDLAPTETAETKKMLDPADPRTWTLDALRRGSSGCWTGLGYCVHEHTGYVCPKPTEIHSGVIRHAESTWVLRRDGSPVEEEKLDAARVKEAQDREDSERLWAARNATRASVPIPMPGGIAVAAPHPSAGPGATVSTPGKAAPPPPPMAPPNLMDARAGLPSAIPPPPAE